MLLKGNPPPKLYSYGNILPRNFLSYIFEFQLVPFDFSLTLEDPFMVSLSPLKYGEGELFSKKTLFMGGQYLCGKFIGGLFYMRGLMMRGKEFHKIYFPVI